MPGDARPTPSRPPQRRSVGRVVGREPSRWRDLARPAHLRLSSAKPVRPTRRERSRPGRWGVFWGTGRLAALVLAIACTGGLVYLLTAQALTVQRFSLRGASSISAQEIAAGSGIVGHNIFTVEPQAVAERLAALPTVREARVWGELPDLLVIRVVERQPVMIWQIGNDHFLLDAGGAVLAVNPPAERVQDLPTVTVREVEPPQVGGRVDQAIVGALALLLHSAPENGLPIAGLDYSPRDGFIIHLDQGRQILFGANTRLPEKLAVSCRCGCVHHNLDHSECQRSRPAIFPGAVGSVRGAELGSGWWYGFRCLESVRR